MHISTDFTTDLPESNGATMILGVVDQFSKIAHFHWIDKEDLQLVARAYLAKVWKYHGFAKDVISDSASTFMGSFFTDLVSYIAIRRSMSTAYH
jgi:hypothetical protein